MIAFKLDWRRATPGQFREATCGPYTEHSHSKRACRRCSATIELPGVLPHQEMLPTRDGAVGDFRRALMN